MTLYVLVACGVSDAGVIGVYSSRRRARAAARKIHPQTDGYHHYDVREYVLDETREGAFPYTLFSDSGGTTRPPVIGDESAGS